MVMIPSLIELYNPQSREMLCYRNETLMYCLVIAIIPHFVNHIHRDLVHTNVGIDIFTYRALALHLTNKHAILFPRADRA